MKVLYFTKYTRKGASSRMRSYQYFPSLEAAGIKVEVAPLFPDLYLEQLYAGIAFSKVLLGKLYIKRFFKLFSLSQYDRIIIEKELFPYCPAWAEWILAKFGVKYIVDYDDAIFHNYDLSDNAVIRSLLKGKIDVVMRNACIVIAGNRYLAERAQSAGARRIELIPTVVDATRYISVRDNSVNGSNRIVIGWVGSPSTTKYLDQLYPVLAELHSKYSSLELHVVGGKPIEWGSWVKNILWTEDSEVSSIKKFDIGVMPLEDTPWERGKCAYKLIQYMACGVPVVASAVGANIAVVRKNTNGVLAASPAEWLSALSNYIERRELRLAHGAAGKEMVENEYALQVTHPKLIQILQHGC